MKRRITSIFLFLLILLVTSGMISGQDYNPIKEECWENLQEWQKFNIVLQNSTGETLSIAGYYFIRSIVEDFYGGKQPWEIQSEGYDFFPDKFGLASIYLGIISA